jgi:hypothetical protein
MIFIIVYILSALVVGSVHYAQYQDRKKAGLSIKMEDRVMRLYILPLFPVVNTVLVIFILLDYLMG